MDNEITRRDFLNGVLIGTGAMLLDLPSPVRLYGQSPQSYGYGGVGDYANSNGNTAGVINAFRSIENGNYRSLKQEVTDTGETYDLAIVGGGLSGLGAAYEFHRNSPRRARCLVLENHPIFGGAAKRNEFLVEGERLIGPQGSNAFGVIDQPDVPGYDIYSELGIPSEFEYGGLPASLKPLDFDPTNFGYRIWFDSKSIGYFFNTTGKWAAGFRENGLEAYPEKIRKDFLRWRNISERHYDGEDYDRWLDSITYKHYLEKVLGLDPEITRFADPVLASVVGLGCDVISAYAARQVSMPGFPEFHGHQSLRKSHWHSFPGGNDGFSRYLVKAIVPDSIEGRNNFADILNGRVVFKALDRAENRVRMRFGASVVRAGHEGSKDNGIFVVYLQNGRLYRVRARSLVMASGSRLSRKIVTDLPEAHAEAYSRFHVSPILVANVALTNWRPLYKLGFTACRWFSGFGFSCNIRKPMHVGNYRPQLHPDKPALLTFYISFEQPGLAVESQGEKGRKKLLGTSYAEFESLLTGQMSRLFGESGFKAENDIAGIVLNRWTYAYVNPQPGFFFGEKGKQAPRDIIRRPFGRISFGHAELNGHQHWVAAVDEGRRAAKQTMGAL